MACTCCNSTTAIVVQLPCLHLICRPCLNDLASDQRCVAPLEPGLNCNEMFNTTSEYHTGNSDIDKTLQEKISTAITSIDVLINQHVELLVKWKQEDPVLIKTVSDDLDALFVHRIRYRHLPVSYTHLDVYKRQFQPS